MLKPKVVEVSRIGPVPNWAWKWNPWLLQVECLHLICYLRLVIRLRIRQSNHRSTWSMLCSAGSYPVQSLFRWSISRFTVRRAQSVKLGIYSLGRGLVGVKTLATTSGWFTGAGSWSALVFSAPEHFSVPQGVYWALSFSLRVFCPCLACLRHSSTPFWSKD